MKHLLLPVLLGLANLQEEPVEGSDDVAPQVEAVIGEYDAAHAAWYEKYLAAEGSAEVMKSMPEPAPYGPRLMALAATSPTSPGAFTACEWVIRNVRSGESMTAAVRHVTAHFLDHPNVGNLVDSIPGGEEANDEFLRGVLEHARSDEVAARACYSLALGLKYRLQKTRSPAAAARIEAEADTYFTRCRSEPFADVVLHGDVKLGDKARADVFEMKNLRVGKTAPEIEGEDIDGVTFELSDYRGKVVMLDFWGDW